MSDGAVRLARQLAAAVALLLLAACGNGVPGDFVIASGSENRTLEPLVQDYCRAQGVTCRFQYRGSLDIALALADGDAGVDAVWPANSIWIEMFDKAHRVRDLTPVARSPVILGVRKSKAEALGWVGRPVTTADILAAVTAKKLTYLASSATQSNSGAGAYLAMLTGALGQPDAITAADLKRPDVQDKVRTLLSGIVRTAGSSGWLADLYLRSAQAGTTYDGMWNYEAVLAETNASLKAKGAEPLYAIYPTDGVAAANSPLGFVERGKDEAAKTFFDGLLAHMLSAPVQQQLVGLGRRPAVGEATGATPDPSWNYDPTRLVTLIRMPEPATVRAALELYQETLRKPSLSVYCLDYSGSMSGEGETALRQAMHAVLSHDKASRYLVQSGKGDRIVVIPFDGNVRSVTQGSGAASDAGRLLDIVDRNKADDGTDIYACAERGLDEIRAMPDRGRFLPAIIVMTDGRSVDRGAQFLDYWKRAGADVPVFGVTFGDADASQLEVLASETSGRVFDGKSDLSEAFRTVRGYN